ncbi:MAG: four helix bundle protein [Terriglobia bacterium]
MQGRSYRDLELWQKAMDPVVECYGATKKLPDCELYGLISQIERAAVSIPANVAEGQGRQHRPEFIQHLSIAYGSLTEVETHIQIARRLNYLNDDDERRLLDRTGEVGRLLNGLLRFLRGKNPASSPPTQNRQPTTDNSCI